MNLRRAKTSDLDSLVSLENQTFNYDQLNRTSFRGHISKNDLWVIELDKIIAGYILVLKRSNSRKLRIYSLAVSSNFQGQGIGNKLVEYAIKKAASNKYSSLKLEVKVDNLGAIKLYESLGFKQVRKMNAFYSDGQDAFVYELKLIKS